MTDTALNIQGRLHCSSVYSANKATKIAHLLNESERADSTNYNEAGEFDGFEYRVEIKGEYGKVAAYQYDEFVGYF